MQMVKRGGLTEMGKLLLLIARERGEDTSTAAGAAPNGSASASQPSQSLQLLQQLPGDLPGEAVHADGVNGTHGSALDAKMESHEAGLQLAGKFRGFSGTLVICGWSASYVLVCGLK